MEKCTKVLFGEKIKIRSEGRSNIGDLHGESGKALFVFVQTGEPCTVFSESGHCRSGRWWWWGEDMGMNGPREGPAALYK
jgi:hypothetical protein